MIRLFPMIFRAINHRTFRTSSPVYIPPWKNVCCYSPLLGLSLGHSATVWNIHCDLFLLLLTMHLFFWFLLPILVMKRKRKNHLILSQREKEEKRGGEIYSHINSNVDSTRGCAAYSERLDNTNRRDPIWNILNFDIISILSGNIYTRRRNILYARQIRILFLFFSLFLLLNWAPMCRIQFLRELSLHSNRHTHTKKRGGEGGIITNYTG